MNRRRFLATSAAAVLAARHGEGLSRASESAACDDPMLPRYPPPGWNGDDPTLAASFPGYTVVNITPASRTLRLDPTRDYFLRLGEYVAPADAGQIMVTGGRNVVLIGGSVELTPARNVAYTRAFLIRAPLGTVHIEGVDFRGDYITDCMVLRNPSPASVEYQGFNSGPDAVVQTQNCRLRSQVIPGGSFAAGHPDCFQVQLDPASKDAFPGALRFDRVTGQVAYQGFPQAYGPVGPVTVSRSNYRPFTDTHGTRLSSYFYQEFRDTFAPAITFEDVWGEAFGGLGIENLIYPTAIHGRDALAPSVYLAHGGGYGSDRPVPDTDCAGRFAEFPALARIIGRVREGIPPGGDPCPDGVPGPAYVARGYLA